MRGSAERTLVVLASFAIVLALVVGYVERAAVDSDQFANRATVALDDASVRDLIAERITDRVVLAQEADLIAARPILQSVMASIVGSPAFTDLFRSAVGDVHRTVFDRDQDTVTLTVSDVGIVLASALEALRPSLAGRVRGTGRVAVIRRNVGSVGGGLARAADKVRAAAWVLLALAVVLVAAALAASSDRRRSVVRLGIGVTVGGVVVVVLLGVGRSLVVAQVHGADARAAAGAVWDAFLGDLRTCGWLLAGAGAVVAAAAASLLRPVDINAPLRRVGLAVVREPERGWLRGVRGVALVLAGVLLLVDGDAVLQLLFAAAGAYLVYAGVSALLWLIYAPDRARPAPARRTTPRRRGGVAALVAVVLIAGTATLFLSSGGVTAAAPGAVACNGHVELCDRPLTDIALPATHNSMSVPLPGWYSSEQEAPIATQLRDGIRGLLIDTHYADRLANGRLRTDVGDRKELRRNAERDGSSPQAVDAALRIRERLGFSGQGSKGMYLCHSFCELGGTPLADVLRDLHDFLIANPGEVVVVINQDYVTPGDFVGAVRAAGLDKLAYTPPTGNRWPTLRQMIDRNQRAIFLAENHAGTAPWYQLAYKAITQETPYAFSKASQLTDPAQTASTCRPNRGPGSTQLFLVNHWVTTDPLPLPSIASKVNAYGPLLHRLRECRRIRHHMPNLVAVNYYRRGALMRAVNALNGVR